ncbi:MAG TPA: hypothetical protein VHO26_05900, partial [Propionibacteriaceae bacterium]|nr:hypothetical protein [Propionibacteriaceae bacterium]
MLDTPGRRRSAARRDEKECLRSHALYRWGRFAAGHAGRVLAVWAVVVLAVLALLVTQRPSISTSLTMSGTASEQVLATLTDKLPAAAGTQGTVAITATDGGRID